MDVPLAFPQPLSTATARTKKTTTHKHTKKKKVRKLRGEKNKSEMRFNF